jgi:putative SOS response-associated peptidase YedK
MDDSNHPALHSMRWGLVPCSTKKSATVAELDFFRMFNCRSETCAEKGVFSRLLGSKRCVVIIEGFYEWKTDYLKEKQPYYASLRTKGPSDNTGKAGESCPSVLFLAGLYDTWAGDSGEEIYSVTLLTCSSENSSISWLHDRMPVLLNDETKHVWLDCKQYPFVKEEGLSSQLKTLLRAYEGTELQCWPVHKRVNKLNYEGMDCYKECKVSKPRNISTFFHESNKKRNVPCGSLFPQTSEGPRLVSF